MNILVTGGAGFIGSHITELLCEEKHKVRVVDDLRFGYKKFVDKRAELLQFPIEDTVSLEKSLEEVDVVMHLAASSIITYSYERPLEYYENNVINGVKLLEAMRKKGVKKIIYSSTSSVYGEPKTNPVKEDDPTVPITSYGASKLAFEHALTAYYHSFGIGSVSLRYYNAYGPRDDQKPRTRAIPMWIEAALENKTIPWYWQGKQTRDYVYVKDIARAHVAVMKLDGVHCFNIGSGNGVLMKDVLHTLEQVMGKQFETIDMGERKGDPMQSYADITKIMDTVGWKPTTSLEKGLAETVAYYKSSMNTHE